MSSPVPVQNESVGVLAEHRPAVARCRDDRHVARLSSQHAAEPLADRHAQTLAVVPAADAIGNSEFI